MPFVVPPPPQVEYTMHYVVRRKDSKNRCVFASEPEASVEVDAQRISGHRAKIVKTWMTRRAFNGLPEFEEW
jgi:hypothetical protein